MTKEKLEKKFPVTFPKKIRGGWTNGAKHWHIKNATVGLYTLDIEHIPDELVNLHNNPLAQENIESKYRKDLCVHKCPSCFNEESIVYSQQKKNLKGELLSDDKNNPLLNKLMDLEKTLSVIDQAIEIAKLEGHEFRSVKFLGPGELLMNPQLFEIIESYKEKKVHLNIFTKGALLGCDELAQKHQNMSAQELTNKLASYSNIGLLMSFQSFDDKKQEALVTTKNNRGEIVGLKNYAEIRFRALENIFGSKLYQNGQTNRFCIVNAPIVRENIDESFDIYKFFVERGTPIVMTPSMLSGKGCMQYTLQDKLISRDDWHEKLIDLYANIYAFNVEKGIQSDEQIRQEGIASYAGAEPCNQVSTGLYIRANGLVQMCPGRFDKETIYANVQDESLQNIWKNSPNKQKGINNPHNLINNRCPAKDGLAFPENFYEKVMQRYKQKIIPLVNLGNNV